MHTEMRHLELVRAVARAGTLTRAGLVLNLTQSALSHQLRDIESRLGARLFSRDGRRLTLTPAGEHLLETANQVLAIIERSEETIRQVASAARRVVRLTTECYTAYYWLTDVLKRYAVTQPTVDVRIDVSATDRPIEALLDGEIDLALVSERITDRRITSRPLFRDEYAAIMRPDHRLASRPFLRPEDFANETLLSYSSWAQSTVCQRLLAPAGVVPGQLLQVHLTEAIVEMAKAGMGIGVLSSWAVAPQVAAGALHAAPLTRGRFGRTWSAAALKRTAEQPHIKDFVSILIEAKPFEMPVATKRRSTRKPSERTAAPAASRRRVA